MMKESLVKKTLQENPSILNGSRPLQRTGTKLKTIIILVAVSSSLTMLLYLGVQIYKVSLDTLENVGPKSAFLPLWLSFDWPWERKFSFPKYLAYFDSEYYAYVDSVSNFTEELRLQKVEFLVLDELFKLKVVRDTFGIPLLLRTEELDSFDIWIECKHPTVHGPTIRISKEHGKLRLLWKWTVHPLSWWGSIDRALTALGLKLDRLDNTEAMKKTHEKSSGRVHEVNTTFEDDAYLLKVTEVTTVSGDCDVTQRKGKVLCIYDMKLRFAVEGTKKDEEESSFTGSVALDEFFHDQDDDEYVFGVEGDNASHIKKHLVPLIKAKLVKFQADLIDAHEKDVQHSTGH